MVIAPHVELHTGEAACEPQIERRRRVSVIRIGPMVGIGLVGLSLLLLLLSYVSQQAEITKLAYELEAVERHLHEVQIEREFLELEKTRLTSLERIERLARTRLGMVDPSKTSFVVVTNQLEPAEVQRAPIRQTKDSPGPVQAALNWLFEQLPHVGAVEAGKIGGRR